MGPAKKKKAELKLEESEIVIEVDKKGACKFKVVSKVESTMQENSQPFNKKGNMMERLRADRNTSVNNYLFDNVMKYNGQTVDPKSPHTVSVYKNTGTISDRKPFCDKRIPPPSCYVALDCEFVGVRDDQSALGRCSIVDYDGKVILDVYARPLDKITTYRTRWSGITKEKMSKAIPLESALSQISDIIKEKIVVGHALHNDFKVLGLNHSKEMTRDTSMCRPLRHMMNVGGKHQMSLKKYASALLGKNIQTKGHCSIIDAQTAMELYKLVRKEWEEQFIDVNKDGRDDNGGGLEERVEASDAKKEKNPSDKPRNADCIVEKDYSVDKIKASETIDGDFKSFEVPEGNVSNVKAGQKRKLPDSFNVTNQIIHVSCQNSLTVRNSPVKEMTSVSCISSSFSDLNKDVHIPSSFESECSKSSSSQDIQADKCSGKVSTKLLKKRKYVSKHVSMASSYSKNVKLLFHDTFWEDQDKLHHYGDLNLN